VARKGKQGLKKKQDIRQQGLNTMARFEITETSTMGCETRADVFCEMGLMYAAGRGCNVDLVAAHKWLNIAAIKGSDRAASLRADLASAMTKMQLAQALREAREWMTMH
jgi:TPR repeat protein